MLIAEKAHTFIFIAYSFLLSLLNAFMIDIFNFYKIGELSSNFEKREFVYDDHNCKFKNAIWLRICQRNLQTLS